MTCRKGSMELGICDVSVGDEELPEYSGNCEAVMVRIWWCKEDGDLGYDVKIGAVTARVRVRLNHFFCCSSSARHQF